MNTDRDASVSPRVNPWTTRKWAVVIEEGKLQLVEVSEPITLQWMQEKVQGLIENVYREPGPVPGYSLDVWGNDEARLLDMPLNVFRRDGESLHGPLVILAGEYHSGDTVPLSLQEANRILLVQLVDLPAPILRIAKKELVS